MTQLRVFLVNLKEPSMKKWKWAILVLTILLVAFVIAVVSFFVGAIWADQQSDWYRYRHEQPEIARILKDLKIDSLEVSRGKHGYPRFEGKISQEQADALKEQIKKSFGEFDLRERTKSIRVLK
jgi:hypothetical protein